MEVSDLKVEPRGERVCIPFTLDLGDALDLCTLLLAAVMTVRKRPGEIGEVITGKKPGRTSKSEITLFELDRESPCRILRPYQWNTNGQSTLASASKRR